MFSLFFVLSSFSESLAREAKYSYHTKCLFLNDEPCMARLTIIDMNYYYWLFAIIMKNKKV